MESHVLQETSPRRVHSCKKRTPAHVVHPSSPSASSDESLSPTPVKSPTPARTRWKTSPRRRRTTFRRISISTTSSEDTSNTITPRKPPARRCLTMTKPTTAPSNERQTRQSAAAKRLLCDKDSSSDVGTKPVPAKRVLRSSSSYQR